MFQKLPYEIIRHIYSYDNTYNQIYKKCLDIINFLPIIDSYKKNKNIFIYQNDNIITQTHTKLHNYLEIKFTITNKNKIRRLKKYKKILLIKNGYYKWIFQILPEIEKLEKY